LPIHLWCAAGTTDKLKCLRGAIGNLVNMISTNFYEALDFPMTKTIGQLL
jgi:hypothetical protein